MSTFINNLLALALESAPWLLVGLIAAGLIRAWLPLHLAGQTLGGCGVASVLRAALLGAPLPLCSCSTLPAALSLRRAGASRASTTSFLIATPETGVDSVALSWVLLGPVMAVIRPLAAIISALAAGLLVGRMEREEAVRPAAGPPVVEPQPDTGCCGCPATPPVISVTSRREGFWTRTLAGLRYAFTDLLDDLALWLLLGLLAAALVVTLVPPDLLAGWSSGLLAMLLLMLISVPMYVCATASTPLAHAMLFAGVSPGTVLVFLLAGPASNIASLVLVRRELGGKTLAVYLFGVGGMSILLGLTLDAAIAGFGIDLLSGVIRAEAEASDVPLVFAMFSLLVLLAMAVRPLRRYLLRGKARQDGSCCG